MAGVDLEDVAVVAACLIVWGLFSRRLERWNITPPITFVVLGLALAHGVFTLVSLELDGESVRTLAELTLALVLFSGAAGVNLPALEHDAGVPARLLGIGLPLCVLLGVLAAQVLLPGLDVWEAAVVAAAVAPTDAALGEAVTADPAVPERLRRSLSVESGLNDGLATPVVLFCIATAAGETANHANPAWLSSAVDILVGIASGIVLGAGVGLLLRVADRRGWTLEIARGIVVLSLALLTYAVAVHFDGNGFIGAFVGGLAFGAVFPGRSRDSVMELDAQMGEVLSALVWFLFGALLVPFVLDATVGTVLFVVLALTVCRMLPVALALLGTGLGRPTVLFLGWFGPRGLATVVFGLLAAEALSGEVEKNVAAAISLTVLVSVVAHGVTAQPGIRLLTRRLASRS